MEGVKISQPFSAAHFPCFYIKTNICIDYCTVDWTGLDQVIKHAPQILQESMYREVGITTTIWLNMTKHSFYYIFSREKGGGAYKSNNCRWDKSDYSAVDGAVMSKCCHQNCMIWSMRCLISLVTLAIAVMILIC